jgi:Protein of unknown function (DUF2934)
MRRAAEGSEERIRQRAYYLWEASGRPKGRDHEFWAQARELIALEDRPALPVRPQASARGLAPDDELHVRKKGRRTSALWQRLRRTWRGD